MNKFLMFSSFIKFLILLMLMLDKIKLLHQSSVQEWINMPQVDITNVTLMLGVKCPHEIIALIHNN